MSEIKNCPLCGLDNVLIQRHGDEDAYHIECRKCGAFSFSGTLLHIYDKNKDYYKYSHILSGLFRELKETEMNVLEVTTSNFKDINT
jgi:hypothetical protein